MPLEDKLKELEINYDFYADDAVFYFVICSTLSQCIFVDILNSIQRSLSSSKLKNNADKSQYMVIQNNKIVRHCLSLLSEDGD